MNKFDGLDIESKFNEVESEIQEDVFDENVDNIFVEQNNCALENYYVPQKKKNKFFGALKIFAFLGAFAFVVWGGFAGHLTSAKTFLYSEYNYKTKQVLSFDEIKDQVYSWFNIKPVVNLNNLEKIEIKKPFVSMDIIEENGNLVFKNLESVFLRVGVYGKVSNITNTLGGRRVEILCKNGCTLVYSGLTYIGTEVGKSLKAGDLFGAANGDVVMSLNYKGEKIYLTLDEAGKIAWLN